MGYADGNTHVMEPRQLVELWVGLNQALEIDVIALLDIVGVERRAHLERDNRHICNERKQR
jgi:hypothetical protein